MNKAGIAIAALLALFMLNYGLVQLGFKPWVYCATHDPLWAIYQPWQVFVVLVGAVVTVYGLARKAFTTWAPGIVVLFGAYILPEWGAILFSLGKPC